MKNKVHLMIDTTGMGLHKRGYRPVANEAPIKETLAAAMCEMCIRDRAYTPLARNGGESVATYCIFQPHRSKVKFRHINRSMRSQPTAQALFYGIIYTYCLCHSVFGINFS